MDWLLILSGLLTLLVSADLLVRGSVGLALRFGIRPMLVGLTVVAFGTSAPELAASLAGSLSGDSGLATGTVLGSNIANLGLILGSVAILSTVTYAQGSARFEMRFLVALTLLSPLPMILFGEITRAVGMLLLAGIAWFTWRMIARESIARSIAKSDSAKSDSAKSETSLGRAVAQSVCVALGLAGLYFGAEWLVSGARKVAEAFGISSQVIGATVVAVGTSLPELAASLVAAYRKHPELALGNVLGSNIFNFCMVLGTTATVQPLAMTWAGEGLHVLAGIAFLITVSGLLHFYGRIGRRAGLAMIASYVAYLALSVLLG